MASTAEDIKLLMKKKTDIEEEMKELMGVLESQKGVGMTGSLIDEEEYPRADIDVYSVRHARHRVICLQNDHKTLMKQIEESLHELHSQARVEKVTHDVEMMDVDVKNQQRPAFAKVTKVEAASPAAYAALKPDDHIIQFGSITKENYHNLQNIATVVQHSKDKAVSVTVLREGHELTLSLIPKTWSGKGLLGCNIVPT